MKAEGNQNKEEKKKEDPETTYTNISTKTKKNNYVFLKNDSKTKVINFNDN